MNNLINHLLEKGIQLSAEENAVITESNVKTQVVPLLHQRVLSVKGPDTEKFLQGQLTCDVTEAFSRGSVLGAHCNIKGHMLSLFRLLKAAEDELWLRMSHDIFDSAAANLKKYIIFSKAEATEISDQVVGLGLTGPGAEALVEKLFDRAPSEDNGIISLPNGVVVRVPGNRFEIWMDQDSLVEIMQQLPDEVAIGSTDTWLLSEIDAGIVDLRSDTQEAFIPQMTNFQAVGGVSFTKGCYTGQEIVTRLQHRGQLKKPMYLAEVTCEQRPKPGQSIDCESKANAGQVVLAAPCNNQESNRFRLMLVAVKSLAEAEPLHLAANPQATLELLDLPYELDPKLFQPK